MTVNLRSRSINAFLNNYGPDEGLWQTLSAQVESGGMQEAIKYHGQILGQQKQEAFKHHQFLVEHSSNEGMAMSVAEAMQNGLVCFVTPGGGIRYYARDMDNSVFTNIADPEAWKQSLDKIAKCIAKPDLYQRVSENAFNRFKGVELYGDSCMPLSKRCCTDRWFIV